MRKTLISNHEEHESNLLHRLESGRASLEAHHFAPLIKKEAASFLLDTVLHLYILYRVFKGNLADTCLERGRRLISSLPQEQ